MRHIFLFGLIILITGSASAGLFITVNGEIDPEPVTISMSNVLDIGLWGDGSIVMGVFYLGLEVGNNASLDISTSNILYSGLFKGVEWKSEQWAADFLNVENPFLQIEFSDPVLPPATPTPLAGHLVENIRLFPENTGLITLKLFDMDGGPMDSQIINVQENDIPYAPEPGMIALLGMGMLMLNRRR